MSLLVKPFPGTQENNMYKETMPIKALNAFLIIKPPGKYASKFTLIVRFKTA